MPDRGTVTFLLVLLALPIAVALFDLSVVTTIVLVLLALLFRWSLVLRGIARSRHPQPMVLEAISISHFVEKVRWCLDRLGADYIERPAGGVMGVLFTGRTVPRLRFKTGIADSSIGNSAEILRFLWGDFSGRDPDAAAFLEPTQERLDLEKKLDRYGVSLQVWIYYHLAGDRELTLHLWGVDEDNVPRWQRLALRVLYPLLAFFIRRTFAITDAHYAKAVAQIEAVLADADTRLADGRRSLLGGNDTDFVDITFAALSGPWLRPDDYGAGRADACIIPDEQQPAAMRTDTARWRQDYPLSTAFINTLYAEERFVGRAREAASPGSQAGAASGDS